MVLAKKLIIALIFLGFTLQAMEVSEGGVTPVSPRTQEALKLLTRDQRDPVDVVKELLEKNRRLHEKNNSLHEIIKLQKSQIQALKQKFVE